MANGSKYFNPIDDHLSDEEQETRAIRQQHAEWGVAVSRLGGLDIEPEVVRELQRYIDGEVSLEELIRLDYPLGLSAQVYQVVARRAHFAS